MSVEEWLAIRKEAALKIDPKTAEVFWTCAQILDPYGVDPELPEECRQVGMVYFARSPGSDVWVCFYDLPDATRDALWKRRESSELTVDKTDTSQTAENYEMTVEEWLAIRKEAALKIDPKTAEVFWTCAQILDPYGVDPELPEECRQAGMVYFARSPGSDVWVCFYDLPDATRDALWKRVELGLA